MLASPILVAWALVGVLAASAAPAGNVYVQIQCGNPPEIAATSHSVELEGTFSADMGSSRFLTPLEGRVRTLRLDGVAMTLQTGEIEDGFIEVEEFGRIFLGTSEGAPGYRAVLRDEQVTELDRGIR